jgi:hypothetical protein
VLIRLIQHCDQILERINLKGEHICFDAWFKRFQSIVLGCTDSGSMVRQNILAAGACSRGHSPCGQEKADRDIEKPGAKTAIEDILPGTYFLQVDPASCFYNLPIQHHQLGTKPSLHEPFGRILHIQTITDQHFLNCQ